MAEKVLDILSRDKRAFVSDKLDLVPRLKHILGIYGGDNSNAATEKVRNKLLEGKEAPTEYGKRFIQEINRLHNLLPKLRNSFYSNTVASDTNEELQKWMNGEYKSEREIRRKLKSISRDGAKANIAKDNLHKLIFTSLHENLNNSKTAQEYIDNLSYITALFSDNWKGFDSNNWKRVSTLKRGAGIISSKTLKGYRGHNKNSKAAGYFVRIEHLNPASKQNIAFQKYAITGKMPNMSMRYDSAVMDNEYALAADSKKINFYINSDKTITIRAQNIVGNRESDAWQMAQNDGGAQRLNSIEDLDLNEDLNNETQMTSEESFIDTTMSNILKQATSIPASEQVSESAARLNAERRKKKFRRLAPSADDFAGLWYSFLGKGKVGDAQIAFFNKYLTEPLNKAYVAMTHARQEITRNYKDLNKEYEDIKKSLNKKSGVGKFTNDQAVRAYLYTKNGESISTLGLTQSEADALNNVVKSNPRMLEYADYLLEIVANDGNWVPSKPKWTLGSIVEDVERVIADTKRAQYLSEWKRNADIIFSKNNLNKIESHYGTFFRKALEDSLYRIEKGKAIPENTSKEMSEFQKWMSGAVSVTMFLNRRSALLQLMSLTNYVNWGDNNPMMAAKAFADIGQYSKDFVRIFNSDYLRERRGGLKTEVEAAVLANELRKSGADGYRGFVNKLLQKGFTLTQIGDSLAISLGGATFYRNRKNTYLKQGMSEREAHDRAWLDFVEATEVSQQSARPDKLSSQQTSGLGRFLLTFQNTPMQYFRIFDKSVSNLVNRRGDPKEHISKILYYTFVAGAIFSYLQQALFAFGDDDEEDEKYTAEKQKRETRVINSTLDTMLKGSGIYGAYMSTLKNVIIEFISQEEKGYKADHTRTFIEALNLAPPLGIKARKLYQGAYMNYKYNNEIMGDMGFDIDNPAYDVGGSLVSAGLNIPADEVINDIRSIKEAFDSQHDAWQRVALLLGYSTWNLGIPNEKIDFLKDRNTQRKLDAAKDKRAKERAIKNKEKEAAKKKKEKEKEAIANKKRKTTGLPKMSGLPKTTGLPKS